MEKPREQLCRLCLNVVREEHFEEITDATRDILDVLRLKLDFDGKSKQIICRICSRKLMEAYKFKSTCLCIDNIIIFYVDKRASSVDLRDIYTRETKNKQLIYALDAHKVCRLCMQLIKDKFVSINEMDVNKLEKYMPEINFSVVEDPVICRQCSDSFNTHSSFIRNCLEAEDKIKCTHSTDIPDSLVWMPSLVSSIEPRSEIKSETNEQEEEMSKTEPTLAKPEDEEMSIKAEPIEIKSELKDTESGVSFHNHNTNIEFVDCMHGCELENVKTRNCIMHEKQLVMEHKNKLEINMYSCNLCGFKTKYKYNIRRHVSNHSSKYGLPDDDLPFHNHNTNIEFVDCMHGCELEDVKTRNYIMHEKQLVMEHKNKLEINMYSCNLCGFKTKYKYNIRRHVSNHSSKYGLPDELKLEDSSVENKPDLGNYDTECNGQHSQLASGQRKPEDHVLTQMYKCDKCDFESKYKTSVKHHQLRHKEPSEVHMYECDNCGYKTKYKSHLVSHQSIHGDRSQVRMYTCDACDFQSKHKTSLKHHRLRHKDLSQVQWYKCDACDFKSKYKSSLGYHQLKHKELSEVPTYKCDACDYESKKKSCLVLHQRKHMGPSEAPLYKCDLCDYETKYNNHLVSHQLKHKDRSQVQLYKCDKCDYETKYNSHLASHQLTHKDPSQVQMYECDLCDFKSKHKASLRSHRLRHETSPEVYTCDGCGYKTKYKRCFIIHQRKHKDPV
ncbi:zinc finger protein 816-like [Anoplophora glabripennis]|uniref:zinc finger protein 816-like n=1 Tax=Anoplophora glabripennis TaxID=217634 RepID=UPI000C783700|nr:zinc finger protein 816-like [Anoplophora glabripennis]